MGGSSLADILFSVWSFAPKTKSNYARHHATRLAEAACRGLITTHTLSGDHYGNSWNITPEGCRVLFETYGE